MCALGLTLSLTGCSSWQATSLPTALSSTTPTESEPTATSRPPEPSFQIYPTLTATPLPTQPPTATPIPESKLCSPLSSTELGELAAIVSDGFHPPPAGQDGRHQGVDFAYYRKFGRASIAGERVQAVLEGTVAAAIQDRFPYGNVLIIETAYPRLPAWVRAMLELAEDQSLYVLYAHLAEFYPTEIGEAVSSCQTIGIVGRSGNAGVAHLHLEMRIGKAAQIFPSMAYYIADATPDERQTYLWWRTSGEFQAIDPLLILVNNQ